MRGARGTAAARYLRRAMDSPSAEHPPGLGASWPGHATVSVQLDGVHLLTDPLLRDWLGPIRRRRGIVDRASVAPVDAVLISHLHHDHHHLLSPRRRRSKRLIGGRGVGTLSLAGTERSCSLVRLRII